MISGLLQQKNCIILFHSGSLKQSKSFATSTNTSGSNLSEVRLIGFFIKRKCWSHMWPDFTCEVNSNNKTFVGPYNTVKDNPHIFWRHKMFVSKSSKPIAGYRQSRNKSMLCEGLLYLGWLPFWPCLIFFFQVLLTGQSRNQWNCFIDRWFTVE